MLAVLKGTPSKGNKIMKRYETLDWLRGLMALSIMIYHLVAWKITGSDASSILGIFGIYGVSIFFVLSGLSMAIVYHNYIKDPTTSLTFFLRRIFRIWPLLWVCVATVSAIGLIGGAQMDILKIP